jgi:hypothetical protein
MLSEENYKEFVLFFKTTVDYIDQFSEGLLYVSYEGSFFNVLGMLQFTACPGRWG